MNYNFTDRLRKVLALAREEAIRLQHDSVGTEHLLLALIREGESVAATVLDNLGIDLEQVQEMVYESVRRGKNTSLTELPLTSQAKSVLDFASIEARELNYSYVGTDHLLPALLREESGLAAEVLGRIGVTLEAVRAETRRVVGPGEPPEPDDGDELLAQTWPTVAELKRSVAGKGLSAVRLSVIADADIIPAGVLAELLGALDGLHRAWGGAGLKWEGGHVGVGAGAGAVL
jgi:ATP-dependent Clp protease ATP-binding subunit ClpA